MSRPEITWKDIRNYFSRRSEYEIKSQGGDKLIIRKPTDANLRGKQAIRIGHRYCQKNTQKISNAYLKSIERNFGVTRTDILNG